VKVKKSATWFDENPELYLIIYKFMFGFTTVILVLSGLRNMGYLKFALYSAISSLMWVLVLGLGAYHCADQALNLLDTLSMYKYHVIIPLIVLGIIVFFVRQRISLTCCVQAITPE